MNAGEPHPTDDSFGSSRTAPIWPADLPVVAEMTQWTSTVIASGVVGNAAYDGLLRLARWLRTRRNDHAPTELDTAMEKALIALARVCVRSRAEDLGFHADLPQIRITMIMPSSGHTIVSAAGPDFTGEASIPHKDLTPEQIKITIRGVAASTEPPIHEQ